MKKNKVLFLKRIVVLFLVCALILTEGIIDLGANSEAASCVTYGTQDDADDDDDYDYDYDADEDYDYDDESEDKSEDDIEPSREMDGYIEIKEGTSDVSYHFYDPTEYDVEEKAYFDVYVYSNDEEEAELYVSVDGDAVEEDAVEEYDHKLIDKIQVENTIRYHYKVVYYLEINGCEKIESTMSTNNHKITCYICILPKHIYISGIEKKNGYNLKWDKNKDVDGYVIWGKSSKNSRFEKLDTVIGNKNTSIVLPKSINSGYYYYVSGYYDINGRVVCKDNTMLKSSDGELLNKNDVLVYKYAIAKRVYKMKVYNTKETAKFTYNSVGLLYEYYVKRYDSIFGHTLIDEIYYYNQKNQLIDEWRVHKDQDGSTSELHREIKYKNGRPTKVCYRSGGRWETRDTYMTIKTNKKNQVTKVKYSAKEVYTFSYDSKSRLTKKHDKYLNIDYIYKYDSHGNIKQIIDKRLGVGVSWITNYKNKYKKGRLVKQTVSGTGEPKHTITYTYKKVPVRKRFVSYFKAQQFKFVDYIPPFLWDTTIGFK